MTAETVLPPTVDLTVDTSDLLKCYGMMTLAMPLIYFAGFELGLLGAFLLLCGMIWNRRLRKSGTSALFANHTSWIKRTFWLSSLFSFAMILVYSTVLASHADQTTMQQMVNGMQMGMVSPEMVHQYMNEFYAQNSQLIMWAHIGCFGPITLHAVWRYIKGYRLADAGREIPNLRTWLL